MAKLKHFLQRACIRQHGALENASSTITTTFREYFVLAALHRNHRCWSQCCTACGLFVDTGTPMLSYVVCEVPRRRGCWFTATNVNKLLVPTSSTTNVAVVAVKPTFIPGCDFGVFDPVIVRRGLRAKHSEQQCRETAVSSTSENQHEPASSHRCCSRLL